MDFIPIIDDINEISPYRVMPRDKDGACLFFTTDNRLIYIVSFIRDESFVDVFNHNAYHIMFKEEDNKRDKYDNKIKQTISAIVLCFLQRIERIILFICDASDSREEARNLLFNKWFNEINYDAEYFKYDKKIAYPDCMIIFSFMCHKNNPYIENCIAAFNQHFD